MPISTGYAIASIDAIKALTPSQRIDYYARHVKLANGKSRWFAFDANSSVSADDVNVLMPNDNPSIGRWIGDEAGSGAASSGNGIILDGRSFCSDYCPADELGYPYSGKAFVFFTPRTDLQLEIKPGFDINITSGIKSIQIYKWNQMPNDSLIGRIFAGEVPHTGGTVAITITSAQRWISFFAKNPSKSNRFDGVCFAINGALATLLSF